MDEELIKKIVARILADPQMLAILTSGVERPKVDSDAKPLALVLIDSAASLERFQTLKDNWRQCWSLRVCSFGPEANTVGEFSTLSCEQALRESDWQQLLIPVCSGAQLAAFAHGLQTSPTESVFAQAVLRGIPVEISAVESGFTERTPAAYRNLLQNYQQQVQQYGVNFGSKPAPISVKPPVAETVPGIGTAPTGCYEAVSAEPNPASVSFSKKLLTEKEAILLPGQSILKLQRDTILTPSAIDALKLLKVQVYREGVRFL